MTAPISNHHHKGLITRKSIFIGAAASLICAPAIVRVTSLMPVRCLILPIEPPFQLNPYGEFCRRNFYRSRASDLRAGRRMSVVSDGKIISEADARRMLSYARAQGWLLTRDSINSSLT